MNFRGYLYLLEELSEALRIVKKSSETSTDDTVIGKFQNREVIKTSHLGDIRGDKSRDNNLSNEDLIKILKSIHIDKKLENNKYYNIVYKNNEGKYNMIIIHVEENKIRIVTIIQQNRKTDNYSIKPGDIKLVIESKYNNNVLEIIEL